MASPIDVVLTALIGAIFGGLGGVASGAFTERLKSGAQALEAELNRLEQFEDELLDVLDTPVDDPSRNTSLRHLNLLRRRLGENIKTKVENSASYVRCEPHLRRMTDFIEMAENALPLTNDIEADVHKTSKSLANVLKRSSRNARSFAWLRE